ncbi:hypothetical protein BC832DRAFT_595066 [Gaertneriomyces semiglobifer]|nr:hypothetical protein BC832DRAFT_595066 [Gaertneriomyces semiglobifer]
MSKTLAIPKLCLFLLVLSVLSLTFNAVSQGISSLYIARNIPAATNGPDTTPSSLSSLSTKVGFWRRCNEDSGCIDLDLPCGNTEAGRSLSQLENVETGTRNETAFGLAQEFVDKEGELCPRMNAARVLMCLALLGGLFNLIGLAIALIAKKVGAKGGKRAAAGGIFAVGGGVAMALCTLTATILLLTILSLLRDLSELSSQLSRVPFNTVTVSYKLSLSFIFVCVAMATAVAGVPGVILLALRDWNASNTPIDNDAVRTPSIVNWEGWKRSSKKNRNASQNQYSTPISTPLEARSTSPPMSPIGSPPHSPVTYPTPTPAPAARYSRTSYATAAENSYPTISAHSSLPTTLSAPRTVLVPPEGDIPMIIETEPTVVSSSSEDVSAVTESSTRWRESYDGYNYEYDGRQ